MSDALLKYIGLCETFGKGISFYFKLKPQTLGFYKVPVGINSLSKILPDLCHAVGIRKKNSPLSLGYMCF